MLSLCAEPSYSRTITAISGKCLHIRCGVLAELCRFHQRQSITTYEAIWRDYLRGLGRGADQRGTDDSGVITELGAGELDGAPRNGQRLSACVVGRHVEQEVD